MTDAAKQTWMVTRAMQRRLALHEDAYLDDLEKFRIKCTGLDIRTGKSTDGSEPFLRPFPVTQLTEIFEQTKPWLDCGLERELERELVGSDMPFKASENPQADARGLNRCISSFFLHSEESGIEPPMWRTGWRPRFMDYTKGERLGRYHASSDVYFPDWVVTHILDKMDEGKTPHVTCLLVDWDLLREDQLSNAEVWCILAVTYRRLRSREYRKHQIIPVTIVSSAGSRLRVVQGYVDGRDQYLHVRKSPIIDFETFHLSKPEEAEKMNVVVALCVGEPGGHTGV
ncbi:hypothetical protein F4802DRAFT_573237 [Xylaria palmicola]|nr:hypothetical protein F4802DRAFT_573237 [Xylaria palmicola]